MIEINKNPSKADLKWFGLIFGVLLSIIAGIVLWRFEAMTTATVLWCIAGGVAVVYYAVPPLQRHIFVGWLYLTYPIGWTVSHVILAFTYYLVLTPIGLIMRALGRDPMNRKLDQNTTTYWLPRKSAADSSRYFNQF